MSDYNDRIMSTAGNFGDLNLGPGEESDFITEYNRAESESDRQAIISRWKQTHGVKKPLRDPGDLWLQLQAKREPRA